MPGYNVDEEVELLANHIKRLGKDGGGGVQVTFKVLAFTLNQFQVQIRLRLALFSNKSGHPSKILI